LQRYPKFNPFSVAPILISVSEIFLKGHKTKRVTRNVLPLMLNTQDF
jgi:hypothetical protein